LPIPVLANICMTCIVLRDWFVIHNFFPNNRIVPILFSSLRTHIIANFMYTFICQPDMSISITIFRWLNVTVCISTNKRGDLSSRMLNLTPCWPILTVYPHYLVTECLEVRRPEGLRRSWWNRVVPTLNFATLALRTAI